MSKDDSTGGVKQFEISLFADLSTLDELERKVTEIIQHLHDLRKENSELRTKVEGLETEINRKAEEIRVLADKEKGLKKNQKDLQKETLIRQRLQELLKKLEGI